MHVQMNVRAMFAVVSQQAFPEDCLSERLDCEIDGNDETIVPIALANTQCADLIADDIYAGGGSGART